MGYQIMVKNEPPETGYRPSGKPRSDRETAINDAKAKAASSETFGRTVQVESDDGIEVITVTYLPGEVLGVNDDDTVERGESKYHIVTDSRGADVEVQEDGTLSVTEFGGVDTEEVSA